jgi:Domain of unknown function (DUF4190)
MEAITNPQPYAPPQKHGTNGMAVASFVLSLLWMWGLGSLLAVIFGVIGRRQTSESGQGGSGLATAGLIIGIVGLVGAVIMTIVVIAAGASADAYQTCINHAQTLAQQAAC